MNNERAIRLVVPIALGIAAVAPVAGGCATAGPNQPRSMVVLQAEPDPGTFETLGMVSGQGATVGEAMETAKARAAEMGANAVIASHQHALGRTWVVSVKAIRLSGPPRPQ